MATQLKNRSENAPPKIEEKKGTPVLIGGAMGLGILLLLPITQWIDAMTGESGRQIDFASLPPPPPPVLHIEEQQQEEEREEIEQMREEPPPPSLEMMELAINVDMSGVVGGDFVMPQFNVGGELEEMIFDIKDLDKRPRALVQTDPVHPIDLRRAGIGGKVLIEMIIEPTGSVTRATVLRSDNPGFNEPALRAVRSWKFEPGEKGGKKVPTRVHQEISFSSTR